MEFRKFYLLGLLPLLMVPGLQQVDAETQIPPWVKGVFSFWVDGGISDNDLLSAITFLIDEDIIELKGNQTQAVDYSDKDKQIHELEDELDDLKSEFKEYKKDYRIASSNSTESDKHHDDDHDDEDDEEEDDEDDHDEEDDHEDDDEDDDD